MQKARRHTNSRRNYSASTDCRHTISGPISLPLLGCFSPFPHGTSSLSVAEEYLALEGGPPGFRRNFTCSALLRYESGEWQVFAYKAVTFYGQAFLHCSANLHLCNSHMIRPTTPKLKSFGLGSSPFARHYSGNLV